MIGKINKIILINLFFFIIFIFQSNAQIYKKRYSIELEKKIEILFDKKNLKKYYKYLSNISQRDKVFLEDKKSFNITVVYKGKKIKAEAKIASHSVDHIDFRRGFSSLVIKLKNGHIENITKFRLLKLVSKGFENEIFWTSLLETMNYPTPHTSIVNVKINQEYYPMIFQEKVAKEFLERWSMKDSPVIEGNFDQFKELQGNCVKKNNKVSECFRKFINSIYYSSKVDNQKFIKDFNSAVIGFKGIVSNNYYKYDKFFKLNKDLAGHGLHHKNSKFVYDSIYNLKIPIYYDGDVDIKKYNHKKCNNINFNVNNHENYLYRIYKYRAGYSLSKIQKCVAKEYLNQTNLFFKKPTFEDINLTYIFERKYPFNGFYNNAKINNNNFKYKQNFLTFDVNKYKFKYCDNINIEKNCYINEKFKNIKKILGASIKPKNYIYDIVYYDENNNLDKKIKTKVIFNDEKIFYKIKKNTLVFAKITPGVKLVNLEFADSENGKIIFIGRIPKNLKIFAHENEKSYKKTNNFTRLDENNLTGCITFIDSYFQNINLDVSNLKCEDSVNIIRSEGSIKNMIIKNAISDALDIDFSRINIENLSVINAKNDCIDFSYGNYKINKANLVGCEDKAISVGEKSILEAIDINVKNSNLAIATKDSSSTKIQNLINFNIKQCLSSYKKKQEFDGGSIFISNSNKCNNNFYDKYSKIIYN